MSAAEGEITFHVGIKTTTGNVVRFGTQHPGARFASRNANGGKHFETPPLIFKRRRNWL